MKRMFDIGDRVICNDSGVVGVVIKFYIPTSCGEQTMVLCDDGRKYHAPTNTWVKISSTIGYEMELKNNIDDFLYKTSFLTRRGR